MDNTSQTSLQQAFAIVSATRISKSFFRSTHASLLPGQMQSLKAALQQAVQDGLGGNAKVAKAVQEAVEAIDQHDALPAKVMKWFPSACVDAQGRANTLTDPGKHLSVPNPARGEVNRALQKKLYRALKRL